MTCPKAGEDAHGYKFWSNKGGDKASPTASMNEQERGGKNRPDGPVLVFVSEAGGHFGDERDRYVDAARDYAFLISSMRELK